MSAPRLRYHQDNTGGPGGTGDDLFAREPAFTCLKATGGGFDFMLAAYHATWSDGDIDDIQAEVRHLPDVFAAMQAAAPAGEGDLLEVRDFNLVPLDLDDAIDIEVPTAGSGSTLNGQGERTGNPLPRHRARRSPRFHRSFYQYRRSASSA